MVHTDESRRLNSKGSGLGLMISKKLVDKLGGNIKLESEENKGTKVTFTVVEKKKIDSQLNFLSVKGATNPFNSSGEGSRHFDSTNCMFQSSNAFLRSKQHEEGSFKLSLNKLRNR